MRKKPIKFKTPFRGKVTYGKTKEEKKIITPLSEIQDKEREMRVQREKDLRIAAQIFWRWKGILTSRKRSQQELLERVGMLIKEIDEKVTSPFMDYIQNEIVSPIIQQLSTAVLMEKFTTKVFVDCPGTTIKNGVESECEWGGYALFHNDLWNAKRCEMDCPECGRRLRQKYLENPEGEGDMILESVAQEWLKEKGKK